MSGTDGPRRPASVPPSRRTLVLGLVATATVVIVAALLAVDDSDEAPAQTAGTAGQVPIDERASAEASTALPEVELEPFGGQGSPVRTAEYVGEPLVLNFWATWCPPCVEEMPALQEFADDAGGPPVLGVNLQDDPDEASELVDELDITYDLAVDGDGELFTAVEGFGMPTTLLVDADGTIRYRHTGPLEAEQLRGLVAEHLDAG